MTDSDVVKISKPAFARLEVILGIAEDAIQPYRKDGVSEAIAWKLVAHLTALGIHIRADREKLRLTEMETSLKIGVPLP